MSVKYSRTCHSVVQLLFSNIESSHRYPPSQLYKVVSDVESYPHFIPYCAGARILSRTPSQGPHSVTKMEAEMTVRFMAFEASYTSHVTCTPNLSVEVGLTFCMLYNSD